MDVGDGVFDTFMLVFRRLRVAESLSVAAGLTGVRRSGLITVLGIMNNRTPISTIRIISRIVIVNENGKLTIIVKN